MTRDEWLEERRKGIGGSDAASVMGLTTYSEQITLEDGTEKTVYPYYYIPTEFQTWLDKTGIEPREVPDSLQMAAGREMEPMILNRYCELTGETMIPKPEIIQHPQFPYIQASLDGLTQNAVLEAKFGKWTPKWGADGSDEVPLNYWIQVQHYLLVTGRPIAHLCAMLYSENGLEYKIYNISPDKEWHEQCLAQYAKFWRSVEEQIQPTPYTIDDLRHCFPRSVPLSKKEATPEIYQAIERLKQIRAEITNLEADADSLKAEVIRYYEDIESLTYEGRVISTYKTNKAGRRYLNLK